MEKGFMAGVILGAVAVAAYEAGNMAKHSIENGKKKVKEKINDIFD